MVRALLSEDRRRSNGIRFGGCALTERERSSTAEMPSVSKLMDRRGERDRPRSLEVAVVTGDLRAEGRCGRGLGADMGDGEAVRDPGGVRSIDG